MDEVAAAGKHVALSARPLGRIGAASLTVDVAIVSAVSLILGLIRLGTPSVWIDESFTARGVHFPLADYVFQYHALYYTLLKPWVALAGTTEWALRLASVVGAMAATALLVVLARKCFDRRTALVSGLLLATSPFMVKWSQQARGYTLVVAVALLSTLLLLRALERGSRSAWVLAGLAFSAVVVWHPASGVLLAPAHAVLVARRRERLGPHWLLGLVVVGALAVPWAAVVAMRSTGEGVAMNWLKFPSAETAAWALVDVSGAVGVGLLLALAGLALLWRSQRAGLAVWLATWAFAPFVLALVISLVRPIYLDRYLIVAAPAFALLAGVALTSLAARWRATGALAAVAATCAGLVFWYGESDQGGNWRGEDWRAAVATVSERSREADAVLVIPWSMHAAAEYYGASPADVSTADDIWVLVWSESGHELPAQVRRPLGFGEHHLVERQLFGWRVSAQLWSR